MALDPKLIIGGAIVAAFLFGGKKKIGTASSTSPSDKIDDKIDDKKGDVGEPVGPNGCKTGLIEKDGICIDPLDPKNKGGNTNGGAGNKPAASELIISKDCKSFQFGDKTGDSWWKNKGEKIAKQWVKSGELDPLIIAFKMISKTGSCFKDFPERDSYDNWFEFNKVKYNWIMLNRKPWELLYLVRNKVDTSEFNGMETVTADPTKFNLGLKFGKFFNYDKFWETLKPMAVTLLQEETSTPGSVLGIDSDDSMRVVNVVTALFIIIFPNVPSDNLLPYSKKANIQELDLYKNLWDSVNEYDGESIDLESEGF